MEFEWDTRKATANEKKHGVSFQEAGTVFGDPLAITYPNPDHSQSEHRAITFGMSRTIVYWLWLILIEAVKYGSLAPA